MIFREIIGNVIIHREYTNQSPTEIIIYKDRVVATNPNIIHNQGPLELVNFRNFPKNPFIRKFFNNLGWSDESNQRSFDYVYNLLVFTSFWICFTFIFK